MKWNRSTFQTVLPFKFNLYRYIKVADADALVRDIVVGLCEFIPVDPYWRLKAPGFNPLNLWREKPVSTFAFKCNLYCYVVPSLTTERYRNKMEFAFASLSSGPSSGSESASASEAAGGGAAAAIVGLRPQGNHSAVVEVLPQGCLLQHPAADAILARWGAARWIKLTHNP
jgi:hypothetical protein